MYCFVFFLRHGCISPVNISSSDYFDLNELLSNVFITNYTILYLHVPAKNVKLIKKITWHVLNVTYFYNLSK